MPFRAIYLQKREDGSTAVELRDLEESSLSQNGDGVVIVDIAYSTVNYKDALAITGRAPVVRRFPMIPGIDLAGVVLESSAPDWRRGDEVVATGCGLGEERFGGLAARASVTAGCLIRKPDRLTLYDTMAIGTAGFTAALSLLAIDDHGVSPADGEVLVTGATGGVGSLAVMLLASAGYQVVASTGKINEGVYLRGLGASEVIQRDMLSQPGRPLQAERWAAAIDTLGSHTLANICASTASHGIVAACGLAQGMDFPSTVAPFILRGVTLAGINSVVVSPETRVRAWSLLERHVDPNKLRALSHEIDLDAAIAAAPRLLAGELRGRLVVNVRGD